jgi:hypothetical protein
MGIFNSNLFTSPDTVVYHIIIIIIIIINNNIIMDLQPFVEPGPLFLFLNRTYSR